MIVQLGRRTSFVFFKLSSVTRKRLASWHQPQCPPQITRSSEAKSYNRNMSTGTISAHCTSITFLRTSNIDIHNVMKSDLASYSDLGWPSLPTRPPIPSPARKDRSRHFSSPVSCSDAHDRSTKPLSPPPNFLPSLLLPQYHAIPPFVTPTRSPNNPPLIIINIPRQNFLWHIPDAHLRQPYLPRPFPLGLDVVYHLPAIVVYEEDEDKCCNEAEHDAEFLGEGQAGVERNFGSVRRFVRGIETELGVGAGHGWYGRCLDEGGQWKAPCSEVDSLMWKCAQCRSQVWLGSLSSWPWVYRSPLSTIVRDRERKPVDASSGLVVAA